MPPEQLMKITDVYTKIKNTDIRAISVAVAEEVAEESFDKSKNSHVQSLKKMYDARKHEASKSIDEVLKEPWLSRYLKS